MEWNKNSVISANSVLKDNIIISAPSLSSFAYFSLPYSTYEKFNAYKSNGQSALLQEVKGVLQKTYSTSYVKGDGQVIGINFWSTDARILELIKFKDILICRIIK